MVDLTFPMLNVTNGTVDIFIYGNTVTDNWAIPIILMVFYIIIFVNLKRYGGGTEESFAATSFSVMVVSVLMSIIPGLVSPEVVAITSVVTAISAILLFKQRRGDL